MSTINMRLAEQLTFIYLNCETWHKKLLSAADANLYHERLLMQGNIITIVENDILVGYMEIWRINFDQLGRLMCGETVYAFDENITDGNIAYVNNGYIIENERFGYVEKKLRGLFAERFSDCKYVARNREKNNQPFKVYPMRILKGV